MGADLPTLTSEQWRQADALFAGALALPEAARSAYVRDHGAGDERVIAEVLALLSAHERSGAFLSEPMAHLLPRNRTSASKMLSKMKLGRRLNSGEELGDFIIHELIGEGAFAHVYRARQKSLNRFVAVKIGADTPGGGDSLAGARSTEARTLAGLEHDHIVPVYSETVDMQAGVRIICMQLVVGTTLERIVHALGKLPPAARHGMAILEVIDNADHHQTLFDAAAVRDRETLAGLDYTEACLWLGVRLADALAFAHRHGILHLDVKPANILLNRYGRPMLSDFNVALTPQDLMSRNPAAVGGTFAYMSPEHLALFSSAVPMPLSTISRVGMGIDLDQRSDVYALGIVLTEMFTCRPADKIEDTASGCTYLHGTDDLPLEVAGVLHRAVRIYPRDRFPDAGELASALENCRAIGAIRRRLPPMGRLFQPLAERPTAAVLFGLIGVNLTACCIWLGYLLLRLRAAAALAPIFEIFQIAATILLIIFAFELLTVGFVIRRIGRGWQRCADRVNPDPEGMALWRRRSLRLPVAVAFLDAAKWPAAAGAAVLACGGHDTCLTSFGPYMLEFAAVTFGAWLYAGVFSLLALSLVVLRLIYPRQWTGCCNVSESVRFELRGTERLLRVLGPVSGTLPPILAVAVAMALPRDIWQGSKILPLPIAWCVAGLVAAGIGGFLAAMRAVALFWRTLAALDSVKK